MEESWPTSSSLPRSDATTTTLDSAGNERPDEWEIAPGDTVQQYELIRSLGRGGMGQVFLARDTRLGRLVALKFMTRQSDVGIQRFLIEARATAQLHHENVVVIHDLGQHRGYPYLVLEYLEGLTLHDWLADTVERRAGSHRDREPATGDPPAGLPPRRVAELMIPVVRALAHAHDRNIVHRDLKPGNILVTDAGTVKVLDFGIAKLIASPDPVQPTDADESDANGVLPTLTRTGRMVGTTRYMSPEQWNRDAIDHRTDIWAAGVILHELALGAHPLAPVSLATLRTVGDLDLALPRASEMHPDLGKLGSVIDRCLLKRKDDRIPSAHDLLRELDELAGPRRAALTDEVASPYPGLGAFQEADVDRYFGRARAVNEVVARLAERPLIVVVGPSGAGKSSFVRAGVIPALGRSRHAWESMILRPGLNPLGALAELLLQHTSSTSQPSPSATGDGDGEPNTSTLATRDQACARLRAEPGYLGAQLRARARRRLCRVVLFVDQFEELYTLADEDQRAAFFACLAGVADDVGSPLRVIVSMRSDFLDRVAEAHDAMTELSRGLMLLTPMDRRGLRDALVRPLDAVDHRFESPELVGEMLDFLAHTAGALPLLQFAAAKMWELRDRERRVLSRQSYEQIGGIAGTLAAHADAVLASMSAGDRQVTRAIFLRLVTPERTRALVSVAELDQLAGRAEDARRVLGRLVDARLLTVEGGDEPGSLVEIVHESLLDRWPTLAHWLSADHEDAAFLARLRHAAREWRAADRDDGLLWRGQVADDARRWRDRDDRGLSPIEADYLSAVLGLARRARKLRRLAIGGVFAALVVVAVALAYLAWQRGDAQRQTARQAERAERAADVARAEAMRGRDAARMAAAREYHTDPTTVLALLREVEDPEHTRGYYELIDRALRSPIARAVLIGHESDLRWAAYSPDGGRVATASEDGTVRIWSTAERPVAPVVLRGHTGTVSDVGFSPDGTRVVSASSDGTARIWSADGTGAPVVLHGHTAPLATAQFSPDSTRILTASQDGTARVWHADSGRQQAQLRGHSGRVYTAEFNPDGTRVVTAGADATARIWNADGTGQPIVLAGHSEHVHSARFSPDGRRVATASDDLTVRIWNAGGTGRPIVLTGHSKFVHTVAWSPDGRRLLSVSFDPTVLVWNADGTGGPVTLTGHTESVTHAAFSPDGTRVVSASSDGTARLWYSDGTGPIALYAGHTAEVAYAEFSPAGDEVVTIALDDTARIWKVEGDERPVALVGHREHLHAGAFGPDGTLVATGSDDETIRLWEAPSGRPVGVLVGHSGSIVSLAFSADGRHLVSTSDDTTARIWPTDGSGASAILAGHTNAVLHAVFSPDSTLVVTTSMDRTARIGHVDGSREPIVLTGHSDAVSHAAFSPDGTRLVTASYDKTARLWNVDGTGEPVVFAGHAQRLVQARFSPDGTRVATASSDGTARVWRTDGTEVAILAGHANEVVSVEFSPDGTRIATASSDHTARVWNADGSGEPTVLRGHTDALRGARFSPDGSRIVTASADATARVWHTDGVARPAILSGHDSIVHAAIFDPRGTRVLTVSFDNTARIWPHVLEPVGRDTLTLWRATTYCMPVALRQRLLGTGEDFAEDDHRQCLARVQAAARSAAHPTD